MFTFSVHCEKNFPLRKQRSDLDIGLALHTTDAPYMAALREHLAALLDLFRPDLVLYDAGVDPHVNDSLGKLDLSDRGGCADVAPVSHDCTYRVTCRGYGISVEIDF